MGSPERSLREQRQEMVEKIIGLMETFESFVILDGWYDAMICSFRLRSSFYCYRKLIKQMKGDES